jgi:hypothetical protein
MIKDSDYKIVNFDFASLYPTTVRDFGFDKTKFRRQKIEKIIQKINDKRTNEKLH